MRVRCSIALLTTALLGAACRGAPPASPSTVRTDPVAANAKCATCHAEIADEWRKSLHHTSFDDPIFQAAYARETQRFCVDCHAPEDASGGGQPALASLGTACTTCHTEPHGKKKRDPAVACAGCHEFSFPGRQASNRPEDRMQRTLSEHAASPLAAVPCTECHMPKTNGHQSHLFGGGRDPAWLRSAIAVKASRTDADIAVTLSPATVAHAVPTGDLFRRLAIGLETVDANGDVTDREMRTVGRAFSLVHGERFEIADTRPGTHGANATTIAFGARAGRVRWFVSYQRVLADGPGDVEIAEDLRVMEGWIE